MTHHHDSFNHINASFPLHNASIHLLYVHSHFLLSLMWYVHTCHSLLSEIMTQRRHTSAPPPLPSSTKRCRWSIQEKDLDDNLSTIPNNYNDRRDDHSKSHDEPLQRPSKTAIGKRRSKVSFTSTLGNRLFRTQLTVTSAQPQPPEDREI